MGLFPAPGTTPPCQFAVVSQLVSTPSPIHVNAAGATKFHPVLLPELTLLVKPFIRALLILYESCTSKKPMRRVPCASICHCVPGTSERRASNWPAAPCKVSVPAMVWVLPPPDESVSVSALATVLVK